MPIQGAVANEAGPVFQSPTHNQLDNIGSLRRKILTNMHQHQASQSSTSLAESTISWVRQGFLRFTLRTRRPKMTRVTILHQTSRPPSVLEDPSSLLDHSLSVTPASPVSIVSIAPLPQEINPQPESNIDDNQTSVGEREHDPDTAYQEEIASDWELARMWETADEPDFVRRERIAQDEMIREKARREKALVEHSRLEQIRQEVIRQEEIRQEKIRQEKIRQEQIRMEQIRQEQIRQERIRQEEIRQEQIRQEQIRLERIRQEQIRQEQVRQEKLRQEKILKEQLRQELLRQERERQEREHLERERLERERREIERQERERLERERARQLLLNLRPPPPPPPPDTFLPVFRNRAKPSYSKEERLALLNKLPLMRYIPAPSLEHRGSHDADDQWEDNWVKSDIPYLPLEENRAGCYICMMDFDEPRRRDDEDEVLKEPEPIRLLPCGHACHKICVDPWILNESLTCPYCRKVIVPSTPSPASVSSTLRAIPSPPRPPIVSPLRQAPRPIATPISLPPPTRRLAVRRPPTTTRIIGLPSPPPPQPLPPPSSPPPPPSLQPISTLPGTHRIGVPRPAAHPIHMLSRRIFPESSSSDGN